MYFLYFVTFYDCLDILDLIAVLCPMGPLRMLIQMAHERQQPLFPALLYSTTAVYSISEKGNLEDTSNVHNLNLNGILQTFSC